jgi:XTP/dITP diphosphohydrolase
MAVPELVVATKNKKKLQEIEEILAGYKLKITSIADYENVPKIIEDKKTFRDNAIKKAMKLAAFTKKLTLGEDSGICVDFLGGRPGVKSARYSGKDKRDDKNNRKLLRELDNVPLNKRKAYYCCAVALADKDGLVAVVEGKCFGLIGFEPKGSFGFGYDPLFIIKKYNKTFAQLGAKVKHKISHRFAALNKIKKNIQKYIENNKST